MTVKLQYILGDATDPQSAEVKALCQGVRLEVFVGEQAVPLEEEIDLLDDAPTTIHILASDVEGTPLGTVRVLREEGHPGETHLGRLAVVAAARGTGLGAALVTEVEGLSLVGAGVPELDDDGVPTGNSVVNVMLSAQEQAMGFYAKCGYQVVSGESYLDAGIPHQDMVKRVVGTVPEELAQMVAGPPPETA